MKATELLNEHGQSLWLDNITRKMLDDGQIQHYIDNYSVTGLTSNPSIFDKAIGSGVYDDAIRAKSAQGVSDESLFFNLAIEYVRRAADLVATRGFDWGPWFGRRSTRPSTRRRRG